MARTVLRASLRLGLVCLALVAPPACSWGDQEPTWDVATISTDGDDDYTWSDTVDPVEVSAPEADEGVNLRQVGAADVDPSRDHRACATWHGPVVDVAQPGIALRIRTDGDGVRAITLTNNVWSGARHVWNVHLADSTSNNVMELRADEALAGFAPSLSQLPPLPWRLCARVRGTTFEAKVWAPPDDPEPAWDDPDHAYAVELPEAWVHEGRPGLYVGHLSPGERTSFTDWTTTAG